MSHGHSLARSKINSDPRNQSSFPAQHGLSKAENGQLVLNLEPQEELVLRIEFSPVIPNDSFSSVIDVTRIWSKVGIRPYSGRPWKLKDGRVGRKRPAGARLWDHLISVNGNVFKRFHFIGFVTVPNDFTSIRIIEAEKTNIGMALFNMLIHSKFRKMDQSVYKVSKSETLWATCPTGWYSNWFLYPWYDHSRGKRFLSIAT